MRLRLSDGQRLDTSALAPSKRSVKNKSGAFKRHNSRTAGSNVGGTKNVTRAIYNNFETNPETGQVFINRSLPVVSCITRARNATTKYTWELGGSCSTGYIGGRGL